MKATIKKAAGNEDPAPREHFDLDLKDLPKNAPISISVLYSDIKDPANYALGETPDGTVKFSFPVIGKDGIVRVFSGEGDEEKHLGSIAIKKK